MDWFSYIKSSFANLAAVDLKSAVLGALLFISFGSTAACAQEPDFDPARYARAVEYCRGDVPRPMALDPDKRVMCFDGRIFRGQDISLAKRLETGGLFVVRSPGGDIGVAGTLANLLRDRRATVVVYDYCFSACASYLLMATAKAFVVRDTLVAWHYTEDPLWCPSLVAAKDGGPKRLEKAPCPEAPLERQEEDKNRRNWNRWFYTDRAVDSEFDDPPESFTIRRILRNIYEGTGRDSDVLWTWNPRHYPGMLHVKIVYEAYPSSQEEVDVLLARLRFTHRIIYDP